MVPFSTSTSLPHRLSLLPEELAVHLRAHGVEIRDEDARRAQAHAIAPKGDEAAARRPLSKRLNAAIAELTDDRRLEVLERATDPSDHFVKYLLHSPDGALHEAVRIPLKKEHAFSVCLSSQVGCAMGCTFCATGRLGLTRNLEAWEMVAAFLTVRDEAPGVVTGAVFQGQGEPFHNYDEVIRAARVLSNPCGGRIAAESITISTVGLVPQIRRFAAEGHPYRLIVSLTSAIQSKRETLVPVASRYSLEDLAAAIRDYASGLRGRMTVAWVVMGGVNTGQDEVDALKRLLGDVHLRVNLIDVNDARPDGFVRASDEERGEFMDRLQILGVPLVRRYSGGARRHAACGMLAGRFAEPV
jgi:23S rRNA (adenine2503-C2)-methyltransferase